VVLGKGHRSGSKYHAVEVLHGFYANSYCGVSVVITQQYSYAVLCVGGSFPLKSNNSKIFVVLLSH
jgi:hypothetical protein